MQVLDENASSVVDNLMRCTAAKLLEVLVLFVRAPVIDVYVPRLVQTVARHILSVADNNYSQTAGLHLAVLEVRLFAFIFETFFLLNIFNIL